MQPYHSRVWVKETPTAGFDKKHGSQNDGKCL